MFKTAFTATLAVVIEATQLQTQTGDLTMSEIDFAQIQDDLHYDDLSWTGINAPLEDVCMIVGGIWIDGKCYLELEDSPSEWELNRTSQRGGGLAQVEHRGVIDKEDSEGDACERDGGEWDGEECHYGLAQISLGLAQRGGSGGSNASNQCRG